MPKDTWKPSRDRETVRRMDAEALRERPLWVCGAISYFEDQTPDALIVLPGGHCYRRPGTFGRWGEPIVLSAPLVLMRRDLAFYAAAWEYGVYAGPDGGQVRVPRVGAVQEQNGEAPPHVLVYAMGTPDERRVRVRLGGRPDDWGPDLPRDLWDPPPG